MSGPLWSVKVMEAFGITKDLLRLEVMHRYPGYQVLPVALETALNPHFLFFRLGCVSSSHWHARRCQRMLCSTCEQLALCSSFKILSSSMDSFLTCPKRRMESCTGKTTKTKPIPFE